MEAKEAAYSALGVLLPAYKWLSAYDVKTNLQADLIAGLTVGVMIIPQVSSA